MFRSQDRVSLVSYFVVLAFVLNNVVATRVAAVDIIVHEYYYHYSAANMSRLDTQGPDFGFIVCPD